MAYTKEDIIRMVREEDIEFIRLQFTDIFGQLKNVAITASQIEKAVNNQIMFDGSSIEGFVRIDESDQYLYPNLDSFVVFPWRPSQGKVARLICDVYNPDGTPFVGDPRGVLKRVLKKAADMGYDAFNVGPEAEFFLFQTDDEGKPTTKTNDEAGYFDLGPLDHGESTRREICMALEQMDFEIEASHHECAQGQHEIDFKYAEALHAADNIMTFKLAVKTLAQKNGLHATFMPKPIFGINGSGMHTNMSLFRGGKNAFYDPDDPRGLSKEAYSFIAGLLAHGNNRHRAAVGGYGGVRHKGGGEPDLNDLAAAGVVDGDHALIAALLGHRHHPAAVVHIGGQNLFVLLQFQGENFFPIPANQQNPPAGIVSQGGATCSYSYRMLHGDGAVHIDLAAGRIEPNPGGRTHQ